MERDELFDELYGFAGGKHRFFDNQAFREILEESERLYSEGRMKMGNTPAVLKSKLLKTFGPLRAESPEDYDAITQRLVERSESARRDFKNASEAISEAEESKERDQRRLNKFNSERDALIGKRIYDPDSHKTYVIKDKNYRSYQEKVYDRAYEFYSQPGNSSSYLKGLEADRNIKSAKSEYKKTKYAKFLEAKYWQNAEVLSDEELRHGVTEFRDAQLLEHQKKRMEMQRAREEREEEVRLREQRAEWEKNGLCVECGGKFSTISKKCKSCGIKKQSRPR